jgi:transposase, IS6 family
LTAGRAWRPTWSLRFGATPIILSAIAEKLKRRSKDDFKGRHFQASLILQAVCWYLRYPLSYRDIEELFLERGRAVDLPPPA